MRAHPLEAVRARVADFRAVFAIPAFATYQLGNVVLPEQIIKANN